jgi:hypothetical protein
MSILFEEKGKIFTNVIQKQAKIAIIQTLTHRIQGEVHIKEGERLKDELVNSDPFLAITNAVVYSSQGELLYKSQFLVLNRDHVVWLIPQEDVQQADQKEVGV